MVKYSAKACPLGQEGTIANELATSHYFYIYVSSLVPMFQIVMVEGGGSPSTIDQSGRGPGIVFHIHTYWGTDNCACLFVHSMPYFRSIAMQNYMKPYSGLHANTP